MLRAKAKFGLLSSALALLIFLLLFFNTLSSTLVSFITGAVKNSSAQILVYNADARRNLQASRLPPDTVQRLRAVPGVGAVGSVGNATLTADAGEGLTDLSLFGWEVGQPGGPGRTAGATLPGPGEALVDRADKDNGFAVGATITIKPSGRTLRIVGYTTDSRFNVSATAYTPIETYRAILQAQNPQAPSIPDNLAAVDVAPGSSVAAVTRAINAANPRWEALSRADAAASVPGAAAISQSFDLIVGIAFIVVVVVTGFFFLILTVQKVRALTTLRAIGAAPSYLASSLLIQVVAIVILSAALATGLLEVAALTSSAAFPIHVNGRLVVVATTAVLLSSLVTSLLPIRRITRLQPADAAAVR